MKHLGGILIGAVLLAGTTLSAEVLYVDCDFKGERSSGDSWHGAFSSLQQAVNSASAGKPVEIWVKAGVYKPAGDTPDATFRLKPGIALYGGFRGSETRRDQRNPRAHRTVLSGDIGRTGKPDDNCRNVVTGADQGRIDGFIITSGYADGKLAQGAALRLGRKVSRFTAVNCTFEKNHADRGGAIFADSGSITLSNCIFYANSAAHGGALHISGGASVEVTGSKFTANHACESGGAIHLQDSALATISRSWFQLNRAEGSGGAVAGLITKPKGVMLQITDCGFSENHATGTGGGLHAAGPFSPVLLRCNFTGNTSLEGAGALSGMDGATINFTEGILARNKSADGFEDMNVSSLADVSEATEPTNQVAVADPVEVIKPVEPVQAKPQEKRGLPEALIYDADSQQTDLRDIVSDNEYTCIIIGDLTDPEFIASYRQVEAAARDFSSQGVAFFYLYSYLLHPENHGYVKPVTLEERDRHIREAKRLLRTRIPWLCDGMDHAGAKALNRVENNLVILNRAGLEEYAGNVVDKNALRKALDKLAGPAESTTSAHRFPAPELTPVGVPEGRVVNRVRISPLRDRFTALRSIPAKSRNPCYVKLRVEADEKLLATGSGRMYLGFHIDPLYSLQWNNLDQPLDYVIKAPRNAALSPSIGKAPKVNGIATDAEAREFMVDVRKWKPENPMTVSVSYTLTSVRSRRSFEVTQRFLVALKQDPFGGTVLGRQVVVPEEWTVKESVFRP